MLDLTLSFFQHLLKRWVSNKLKAVRVIFTSCFVPYYTHFNKSFLVMVIASLSKNLGPPISKQSDVCCLQGSPRTVGKMYFLLPCQIDLVNKQLSSTLSWNNPLAKTALGQSYILMIDRHLDAEKKHSMYIEGVCNLFLFFCLLQGCPTANFAPLLRGSITNPMQITTFDTYLTQKLLEAS